MGSENKSDFEKKKLAEINGGKTTNGFLVNTCRKFLKRKFSEPADQIENANRMMEAVYLASGIERVDILQEEHLETLMSMTKRPKHEIADWIERRKGFSDKVKIWGEQFVGFEMKYDDETKKRMEFEKMRKREQDAAVNGTILHAFSTWLEGKQLEPAEQTAMANKMMEEIFRSVRNTECLFHHNRVLALALMTKRQEKEIIINLEKRKEWSTKKSFFGAPYLGFEGDKTNKNKYGGFVFLDELAQNWPHFASNLLRDDKDRIKDDFDIMRNQERQLKHRVIEREDKLITQDKSEEKRSEQEYSDDGGSGNSSDILLSRSPTPNA